MGWWKQRKWVYPVIHLVGAAGVAGTALRFFGRSCSTCDERGWRGLWTTFAPELLLIWITVVAIDQLVEARREAETHRADLRGGLNYIGGQMAGLLPNLYDWNIRQLADEIRWWEELVLDKAGSYADRVEMATLRELLARAKTAHQQATELLELMHGVADAAFDAEAADRRARKANRDHSGLWEIDGFDDTRSAFRLLKDRLEWNESIHARFVESADVLERAVSDRTLDPPIIDALRKEVSSMRQFIETRHRLEETVAGYLEAVRTIEYKLIDHKTKKKE